MLISNLHLSRVLFFTCDFYLFVFAFVIVFVSVSVYLLIGDVTSSSCVPFYPLVRLSSIAVAFGGSPLSIY